MTRKLSFLLVTVVATFASFGQSAPVDLPASTLIPHYRLSVAYNTTTILVFPSAVRPVDRGDRDILAIKQPGVDNVLKVKASRRNFNPTNLHVFTSDGRLYAFDVTYTDSMASSRDLTSTTLSKDSCPGSPVIILSGQAMNDDQLEKTVVVLRHGGNSRSIVKARRERMTLALDDILQNGTLLFFRLKLQNRSGLLYQPDFLRCYIRDRQKAKRTSIQEKEIIPVYQDSMPAIMGHSSQDLIIALPLFTLAGGKEGIIEIHERNGGRSLVLHLHNRTLLKARTL